MCAVKLRRGLYRPQDDLPTQPLVPVHGLFPLTQFPKPFACHPLNDPCSVLPQDLCMCQLLPPSPCPPTPTNDARNLPRISYLKYLIYILTIITSM